MKTRVSEGPKRVQEETQLRALLTHWNLNHLHEEEKIYLL